MDVEAYIKSGILEMYATGTASQQERSEVECLSNVYPEIATELAAIQDSLETYAARHQQTPSSDLKSKILTAIDQTEQLPKENLTVTPNQESDQKAAQSSDDRPKTGGSKYQYWMAASIVLAMALGGLAVWNNVHTEEQEERMENLNQEVVAQQVKLQDAQDRIALLARPGNRFLALNGTEKYPQAQAQILWNTNENSVHIIPHKLQPLQANQDYQLWAIDKEGPKSLGIVSNPGQNTFLAMQGTKESQAFAITIEPKNGSTSPTLEQMVVIGEVN